MKPKITTAAAVARLRRALRADEGYRQSWHANIAMAFIDIAAQTKAPLTRQATRLVAQAAADAFLLQLAGPLKRRRKP